jgi:hypothetical protein
LFSSISGKRPMGALPRFLQSSMFNVNRVSRLFPPLRHAGEDKGGRVQARLRGSMFKI